MHPNQEGLLGWREWHAFLQPYIDGHRSDADFERRLHAYLAVFSIFWLGFLLQEGLHRTDSGTFENWRGDQLEPNHRFGRYLGPASRCPLGVNFFYVRPTPHG